MVLNKFLGCTEAVEMIPDGAVIMIGGFMGVGSPHRMIAEMVRQGQKDLTIIANDTGTPGFGVGQLVAAKRIRKLIASHIGLNPETQRQVMAGEMEAELCPQGTLAETDPRRRLRTWWRPHADGLEHCSCGRQTGDRYRRQAIPA